MSNQLTVREKQTVRAYVLGRCSAKKARITADGVVTVYGTMPNTDADGWYFAGWAEELLATAKAEQ